MDYLDVHTDEIREVWQSQSTQALLKAKEELSVVAQEMAGLVGTSDSVCHDLHRVTLQMQDIDKELESRSDGVLIVRPSKKDGVLTLDFNIGGVDLNSLEVNTVFGEDSRGMLVCFAYAEWWDGAMMVENGINAGRFKALHSPSRTLVVVLGSKIKGITLIEKDNDSSTLSRSFKYHSVEVGVEELNRKFYV